MQTKFFSLTDWRNQVINKKLNNIRKPKIKIKVRISPKKVEGETILHTNMPVKKKVIEVKRRLNLFSPREISGALMKPKRKCTNDDILNLLKEKGTKEKRRQFPTRKNTDIPRTTRAGKSM